MKNSSNAGSGQPLFVVDEEACDLDKAEYSQSLSYLDLDDSTKIFSGTIDRISFQTPLGVVKRVLQANGYVLNFENILASLDDMRLVTRVRMNPRHEKSASQFLPALQFRLPGKKSTGELLSTFYEELNRVAAETEVQAQIKPTEKKDHKSLEDELESTRSYAAELESRIQGMAKEMQNLRSSVSHIKGTEGEVLPENTKLGRVKAVNLDERVLVVTFGRTNLKIPLSSCYHQVEVGEPCIVSFYEGKPEQVVFYDSNFVPMDQIVADVLYSEGDVMKVREKNRHVWLIKASSDIEKSVIASLKRGDMIVLGMIRNRVARFEKSQEDIQHDLPMRCQKKIIIHQIAEKNMESLMQASLDQKGS